ETLKSMVLAWSCRKPTPLAAVTSWKITEGFPANVVRGSMDVGIGAPADAEMDAPPGVDTDTPAGASPFIVSKKCALDSFRVSSRSAATCPSTCCLPEGHRTC